MIRIAAGPASGIKCEREVRRSSENSESGNEASACAVERSTIPPLEPVHGVYFDQLVLLAVGYICM